jgi:hypothetical protein
MNWIIPRMWDGADVWIIGGGPSLPKQFGIPNKVVQSVISGSALPSVYSPYMEALHNKHVIGINVAFLIGDWIDMVFFGDGNFFLQNFEKLAAFPGLKVSCDSKSVKYGWVKNMARDGNKNLGLTTKPGYVSWNFNSGCAAINVAANAGAKRIILLGFDMKLDNSNLQYWHDLYGKGTEMTERRLMGLPFERHLRGFPAIAADAKARGIEILNGSPDSAIEQFPKFTVKELLYDNA